MFLISVILGSAINAQTFQKLDVPRKEATGGYHGGIYVSDAAFINYDRHIVYAINESITVCEAATGKRLYTLLNGERGGRSGWKVVKLHLVEEGQTVLCDPGVTHITPDDPTFDSCRWMCWDVAQLTSEAKAEPIPTPLFSREGLDRGRSNPLEKGLEFITQLGPNYIFLCNSRSPKPTTIRTYRRGDRIDSPRQEIPVEHDDPEMSYVFATVSNGRTFIAGSGAAGWADMQGEVAKCIRQRLSRDERGSLAWSPEPIEVSEPIGKSPQTIVRRSNGGIHSEGHFHRDGCSMFILDDKLVPLRGLPTSDGRYYALSGHATIWFDNGYRSIDPVGVTIWDRETAKPICSLACGKGESARPLAFSSDGTKLVTVHDLARPDVRVWTLSEAAEER